MKAKMNNWNGWVHETRPDFLVAKYEKMLRECGFNVIDCVHHFFSPYGFTALFLLGESHFAIHTFPEERKTYNELTSCVVMPYNEFIYRAVNDVDSF